MSGPHPIVPAEPDPDERDAAKLVQGVKAGVRLVDRAGAFIKRHWPKFAAGTGLAIWHYWEKILAWLHK